MSLRKLGWGSESDLALRISCDSPHKNELTVSAKKAAVFCTTHKPMAVREPRRVSIDLERPSARFPSFGSFARPKQSCASASQRVRTSRKLDCWAMLRNAAYKRSYSSECIIALSRSGHENIDLPACGEQVGAIVASGRPLPAQCVNTVSVVRRNLLNIAHFNSARDFSTAIKSRTASSPRKIQSYGTCRVMWLTGSLPAMGSNRRAQERGRAKRPRRYPMRILARQFS